MEETMTSTRELIAFAIDNALELRFTEISGCDLPLIDIDSIDKAAGDVLTALSEAGRIIDPETHVAVPRAWLMHQEAQVALAIQDAVVANGDRPINVVVARAAIDAMLAAAEKEQDNAK